MLNLCSLNPEFNTPGICSSQMYPPCHESYTVFLLISQFFFALFFLKLPFTVFCFLSLLMFSSYAAMLEKPLEKKAGRNYGPPGSKRLIYFLDDMNMPEVDAYGTVQPHTLIRQHMDYSHWYGCHLYSVYV